MLVISNMLDISVKAIEILGPSLAVLTLVAYVILRMFRPTKLATRDISNRLGRIEKQIRAMEQNFINHLESNRK